MRRRRFGSQKRNSSRHIRLEQEIHIPAWTSDWRVSPTGRPLWRRDVQYGVLLLVRVVGGHLKSKRPCTDARRPGVIVPQSRRHSHSVDLHPDHDATYVNIKCGEEESQGQWQMSEFLLNISITASNNAPTDTEDRTEPSSQGRFELPHQLQMRPTFSIYGYSEAKSTGTHMQPRGL